MFRRDVLSIDPAAAADIAVADEEVTPANLETIGCIARFVAAKA